MSFQDVNAASMSYPQSRSGRRAEVTSHDNAAGTQKHQGPRPLAAVRASARFPVGRPRRRHPVILVRDSRIRRVSGSPGGSDRSAREMPLVSRVIASPSRPAA